jgi:copper resistance protein B
MPGMEMHSAPNGTQGMSGMHGMPGMGAQGGAHSGHAMSMGNEAAQSSPVQAAPPPPPPADHAADRYYDPAHMAAARKGLRNEQGGQTFYMVLFNLAEYQVRNNRDSFRWDGEGWAGGDLSRLWLKSEGEGDVGRDVGSAEIQALYSRAVGPYTDIQAGIRQDFKPNPSRTYATVGFETLAPLLFEAEGALFLSNKGDLLGRLEGYFDQRITQRLILQPRVEFNLAAQDVRATGTGAGLSDAEVGLRLRYEIRREFAPYIGVSWERKVGHAADFAHDDGEEAGSLSFVTGIRFWF